MKKFLIMAALAIFAAAGTASAQNYMVVNTETVFKSLSAYNQAVAEVDAAAKRYQQNIDNAYADLEQMYETYMSQKASMSQNARRQYEETILSNEKKIAEYQADIFGEEGKITKMQAEKLEPYRKKVTETISEYAAAHGYALVLDIAANPLVIYYSPSADKTQEIISLLK
jgi:outer membrane protein